MRTTWAGVTLDALDYELVQVRSGSVEPELGDFRDAWFVGQPTWRLVSGYLMMAQSPDADGELLFHSHGRHAISLCVMPGHAAWHFTGPWTAQDGVVRSEGIALVLEAGSWIPRSGSLQTPSTEPWSVTVVHGPSPEKIDNRIALLASLRMVGGRHD